MDSPQQTNTDPMINIAYADCFSGVSGDMFLGALLDAGFPEVVLLEELGRLGIDGFECTVEKCSDSGITATRVTVRSSGGQPRRTWREIRELIGRGSPNPSVRERALAVFACLAEAEAGIHGCRPEDVHFHEIGGIDAIVDIVGSAAGLEYFNIETIFCSPLPMTRGWVQCDHGLLPLPAPAVCEILKGVPVYGIDLDLELVTPTGAALMKTLSSGFGRFPGMAIVKTGYGAGSHKLPGQRPNLFRLVMGQSREVREAQEVEVIETNLDDWSPEGFPYLMEQLFSLGALDVSLVPIHMKKGRPGFLLRVISPPALAFEMKQGIFAETTAIGLRYRREMRMTLPRKTGTVPTPWGPVAAKKVETPKGAELSPEYEDCRRVARANRVSLKEVYSAVARLSPEDFVEGKEKDKGE